MNPRPLHKRPGFRTLAAAAAWVVLYLLVLNAADPPARSLALIFDVGLFVIAGVLVLALVSQFLLPVQSYQERVAVISRLLDYALGSRGPVLFLREGEAVESRGERGRVGAGVLLADYTSAGVLRTESRFTRAVGPGLTFTEPGERLAAALDLRRQIRTVTATMDSVEAEQAHQPIDSTALTEDGITVAADLSVTFMLDPGHNTPPREGQSASLPPYEFNRRAAERAVYGHAHRQQESAAWTDLPLLVAVDLWREQVKQWRLDDLLGATEQESPLKRIEAAIESRLTPAQRGQIPGGDQREMQVLQKRGLRVLGVSISNLQVPSAVRDEHLRRWREAWGSAVEEGVLEARGRGQEARWQGEQQGQAAYVEGVTRQLRKALAEGVMPDQRQTLLAMAEDALQLLQEPDLPAAPVALRDAIAELASEIRGLDSDCRSPEAE